MSRKKQSAKPRPEPAAEKPVTEITPAAAEELVPFLVGILNEDQYLLPLPLISRIIPALEIFPLPAMPEFLAGVFNNSGDILPVIDLKKVLQLPEVGGQERKKFVLCKYQNVKVGLIIDDVLDLREIPARCLKADASRSHEFISASFIKGKEILPVIDIAKIIDMHKARP